MKAFFKTYKLGVLAGVIFCAMTILNLLNKGSHGGGDTYMHYLFAYWSFEHPHLLFDHWGKPLFTILSSPFAQLGFKGSVTFNILAAIGSGILVAKSAQKMGVKGSWLGLVATVFTPMFFVISFSSLTEILFAFTLILAIYLFISKKYMWSAIVISFIPFARTEGVIFLPLFLVVFATLKDFKSIGLLFTGFIVMSLVGYPVYQDFLWPITKIPYHDSSALYGNGTLFHFMEHSPAIFGWPLLTLFFVGFGTLVFAVFKRKNLEFTLVAFLVLAAAIGYFCAHSVVWAFGMGGSLGLTRVMAGIIPLVALIAIYGVNYVLSLTRWKEGVKQTILIVLAIVFVVEGYTKNKFPLELGQEEKVLAKACEFIVDEGLQEKFIVFYNSFETFTLEIDHFSIVTGRERVFDKDKPSKELPVGGLIIWDAHFGPNEGGLPKENLMNDPELNLIGEFKPEHEFHVLGDHLYEVLVFQKIDIKVE